MRKRLTKSATNSYLAGVCGGIGEYFGIDPTIVRLLLIGFTVMGGSGILAYIIAYFVMPDGVPHEPTVYDEPPHDYGNGNHN